MKIEFTVQNENGMTTIRVQTYIGHTHDRKAQYRTDTVLSGVGRFVVVAGSAGNFCGLAGSVVEIPENYCGGSDLPKWNRTVQSSGGEMVQTFWPVSLYLTKESADAALRKQIDGSAPDFRGVEELLNSGLVKI